MKTTAGGGTLRRETGVVGATHENASKGRSDAPVGLSLCTHRWLTSTKKCIYFSYILSLTFVFLACAFSVRDTAKRETRMPATEGEPDVGTEIGISRSEPSASPRGGIALARPRRVPLLWRNEPDRASWRIINHKGFVQVLWMPASLFRADRNVARREPRFAGPLAAGDLSSLMCHTACRRQARRRGFVRCPAHRETVAAKTPAPPRWRQSKLVQPPVNPHGRLGLRACDGRGGHLR